MREKSLILAYVYDKDLHKRINRSRKNYWDVYIREINEQLGLRGERVSLRQLKDKMYLSKISTLIIGWQSGAELNSTVKENLKEWVKNGGMLIGFGVKGLDELFGIESFSHINQFPNGYIVSGYFEFLPHRLTENIHSSLSPKQKLLIFSDIQLVKTKGAVELAHLYDSQGKNTKCSAILWHKYGKGYAAYFTFDVAKTIWLLHQGRPYTKKLDKDENLYRQHLRLVGKDKAGNVLYADEILFLLQNIIAQHPYPFIYQIPPKEGKVPKALMYWGGDGCGNPGSKGLLSASNWMKSKGLPYHINVLSKGCTYDLTLKDAEMIKKNGHELSVEYYFCYYGKNNFDLEITDEDSLAKRYKTFKDIYGISPICTGCHGGYYSEKWGGWIEDMKWRMRCGGKADNTFMGDVPPGVDGNASRLSFGHGTSYPYYFYNDFQGENKRIDFIEEPLSGYELGRRGASGDPEESIPPEEVHPAIDMAIKYHLTLNMFYHAVNIAKHASTRAIEEIFRYIAKKKVCIVHLGNDELWRWWDARSKSQVSNIQIIDENHLFFQVDCKYTSGMIIKIALPNWRVAKVLCDTNPTRYEVKNEFGSNWVYIIIQVGKHNIDIIREVKRGILGKK